MNDDPVSKAERKEAVRALLVSLPDEERARQPVSATGDAVPRGRWFWVRPVAAIAIAAVVALIAYLGVSAVHAGVLVPALRPDTSVTPVTHATPTIGAVIGSWSSDANPVSYGGTVSTGGLAISVTVTCSGSGSLTVSLSHVSTTDGSCSGTGGKPETSRNSGGVTKPVVVKIHPHDGDVTWKVVLRAIAPTTFTPVPVRATDDQGRPVPYCTSAELTAKYVHVPEQPDMTGTTTAEIVVTNSGAQRCAISGYPTGTFTDANGTAIGHHANKETDSKNYATRAVLAPVLLQPGRSGYLQISIGKDIANCRPTPVSSLRFTGDNSGFSPTVTFTVPIPTTEACSNPGVLQLFASLFVDYPSDLRTPAQITKAVTCRLDELAITLRKTPDQSGEQTGAIGFTNTGTRSCHLNGTPSVSFLTDAGTTTGHPTGVPLHGGDPTAFDSAYEVLARGKTVYVHYAIQNAADLAHCTPATVHRIRTTTGGFGYSTELDLPGTVAACTNANVTQLRATGFISERNYTLDSLPGG